MYKIIYFFLSLAVCLAVTTAAPEEGSANSVVRVEEVTVIGITPASGKGLQDIDIPWRVQSITEDELDSVPVFGPTDLLNSNIGSVSLNYAQGNTLQPDLQYRGFSASPLLGLPIGITVFQNGVRVNEIFGDVVNWELLPLGAVDNLQFLGGGNPVYGLNSLGGVIVANLKDGFNNSGHRAEVFGGGDGLANIALESGGNNGTFGYYAYYRRFYERGWRILSNSRVKNFYASFSWRKEQAEMNLNFTRGYSELRGNGPLPLGLLQINRKTYFTAPDITANDMRMVSIDGAWELRDDFRLSGVAYHRKNLSSSFNGDAGDDEEMLGNCPPTSDSECDAVNNQSFRDQVAYGGTLQLDFAKEFRAMEHNFILGLDYRDGDANFQSSVMAARFNDERASVGSGSAAGALLEDEGRVLASGIQDFGVFFIDTIYLDEDWTLNLSARSNHTKVVLEDKSGDHPELNGRHRFSRFNPAIGLTWQWRENVNFYSGYKETTRAPTPVELACSEEVLAAGGDEDCRLPNAFLADPPLEQIVSKSFELGVRGDGYLKWHVGAYHTRNNDDIIWQSSGRNRGVFMNVDLTRRVGWEASISGAVDKLRWQLDYGFVKATFGSDFEASSPNHQNASPDGKIFVRSGDRIPSIPEHTLKLRGRYALTSDVNIGAEVVANSGQLLRGDETNQLPEIGGYAVVNAYASWLLNSNFEIFVRADNIFDKKYETFGVLGEDPTAIAGLGDINPDNRFYSPAPPFRAWIGIRAVF